MHFWPWPLETTLISLCLHHITPSVRLSHIFIFREFSHILCSILSKFCLHALSLFLMLWSCTVLHNEWCYVLAFTVPHRVVHSSETSIVLHVHLSSTLSWQPLCFWWRFHFAFSRLVYGHCAFFTYTFTITLTGHLWGCTAVKSTCFSFYIHTKS